MFSLGLNFTLLFGIKIHFMGVSLGFGRHQGCIDIRIEASIDVSLSVHHQTLLQLGVCLLTGRSSVESHSRYSATCTIWLMMRSSSYVKTKHNLQDRETIILDFRIASHFKHGANTSLFLNMFFSHCYRNCSEHEMQSKTKSECFMYFPLCITCICLFMWSLWHVANIKLKRSITDDLM